MRRILVMVMVLALAALVPMAALAYFSDVPEAYWAYECINELKNAGVIDGYEDGSFRPEGTVTRAETARMLCDIASLPEGSSSYDDVSADDWFYTYARDCGVYIEEGSEFSGNDPMTREGLADAIVRILKLDVSDESDARAFSDYESFENPGSIAAAVKAGFVSGYEDGSFRPSGSITRAEICSMLSRAFEVYNPEDGEVSSDDPTEEEIAEPAEKTWTLKKLANADFKNFRLDTALAYKKELVFIEDEEYELLFKINLPYGETERETMWRLPSFTLRPEQSNQNVEYTGFVPHSVLYDDNSKKTLIFGRFTLYKDASGTTYEVSKYCGLDISYRIFDYAQFAEGRVQHEDDEDCIPKLLYVHNEKYSLVYNGKSSVYMFELDTGRRQGELYVGKEDTYLDFLSTGERMFGVDKSFNLKEYDFDSLEWMDTLHTFEADVIGSRDGKFWLWDTEGGRIFTSTPDGRETTVHEDIAFENIEVEEGLDLTKLDSYMQIYDDDKFILYDGKTILMLEKM